MSTSISTPAKLESHQPVGPSKTNNPISICDQDRQREDSPSFRDHFHESGARKPGYNVETVETDVDGTSRW